MSLVKRQMESKKKYKKERKFKRDSGEETSADWMKADMAQIQETIAKVTAAGGALRFGYTVDGGAYALGIYGDGASPYTEYIRPSEDIDRILADLGAAFDGEETDEEPVTRTAGKSLPSKATGKPQAGPQ